MDILGVIFEVLHVGAKQIRTWGKVLMWVLSRLEHGVGCSCGC